jgi:UPF0755 protein
LKRRDRIRRRREREAVDARLEAVRPSDDPSLRRPRRGKPKKRRRGRKTPSGRLLLLALLLLGVFCGIYLLVSAVLGGGEEKPMTVAVEQGDTLSSVADKLEEAGVIQSSKLFKLETRIKGGEMEIKAGEYRFVPGEDSEQILETLSSGESISAFNITVPEGLTLEQTARVVEEEAGIPAEEFETAAERTDYEYDFLEDPAIRTTEGFLFPKKYEFERGVDAAQIVDRFLQQYLLEKEGLVFAEAQDRFNLTEYELVTVASLVEKESANPEERSLIAGVIYNRIRSGMPLQVDATVQYALGKAKEDLKLDDLDVDSPYNTYKNPGLPPGPISSPSRESIQAALEPAQTDYLYYVLEAGGEEHFFTDDYEEFLDAKQKREPEQESKATSISVTH